MPISLDEYRQSFHINAGNYPFYSLIVAAIRQADTENLAKLKRAFPDVWKSFWKRYESPGGYVKEWDGER